MRGIAAVLTPRDLRREMDLALILNVAAVLVAAIAVLPGSLGIVMFTHKILAGPRGALLFNVLALPL